MHLNPFSTRATAVGSGYDTNPILLREAIREMRRADPDPPVVILAGDFLAHHFRGEFAVATMRELARQFDSAFPRAQFVIVLGNNDAECGDYRIEPGGTFLREVAHAWAPLVNRHGMAPGFARDFPALGAYVARLPGVRARAVVIDDTFWSVKYASACGGGAPGDATLSWLRRELTATPPSQTNWLFFHEPPGIDAFSTRVTRDLFTFAFLEPRYTSALSSLVLEPRNRVALAMGGHTHTFSFRLIGNGGRDIPMLVIPAISPVYGNSPSFLTVDVGPGGIRDAREHARVAGRWKLVGGLASSFGLPDVGARSLHRLEGKLQSDARARTIFGALYGGGTSPPEFNETTWPEYTCASIALSQEGWRACRDRYRPRSARTSWLFLVLGVIVVASAIVATLRLRRRAR